MPVNSVFFGNNFSQTFSKLFSVVLKFKMSLLFVLFITKQEAVMAQNELSEKQLNKEISSISGTSEHAIRFKAGGFIQPWLSYAQLNPGSLNKEEKVLEESYNVSIRRMRVAVTMTYKQRWNLFVSAGFNNLNNTGNPQPSPKILDLYTTYSFADFLTLGAGRSPWDGLSRYTTPSTSTMLFTDLPLIAQPTLNITDDTIRNLSVFLYGNISNWNYRLVIKKPYDFEDMGLNLVIPDDGTSQFSNHFSYPEFTGYLKYDFLEKELLKKPSFAGTYLGKKQILSLGWGAKYRQNTFASQADSGLQYHDMNLWAVDIFFESPLLKYTQQAITAYAAYYNYDMGPDYLRSVGVNNPAYGWENTMNILNGKGNSFPVLGSGHSTLLQLGYLFNNLGKRDQWGALQFYTGGQFSNFDALADTTISFNAGLNWYLDNQRTKVSLDLQNRPLYSAQTGATSNRRNMIVLQYQYQL
ncbi:hypothetical protein D3A96_10985 [Robertkochia marina]|nr:hypothetical protein D3A96_10985 [Robertkochia marina]